MSIFPEKDYDSSFYHLAFRESMINRASAETLIFPKNHVLIILYLWCVDF